MLPSRLTSFAIAAIASLCATSSATGSSTAETQALVCDNGVYRLSPPGIAAAVYFQLKNRTDAALILTGATSSVSSRVEIHKSGMENGMMTMEPKDELPVAKGQTLAFKPGGYHLMVFTPKGPLKVGDTVSFQLQSKSGKSWPCQTTVKKHYSPRG